ncbi:transposase [Thalassotalea fusca]
MPKPREQQISLSDTPYYHVCSRVVRKAFLCGVDESSGVNYEHRRAWVEERIHQLSQVYSIDICAYAVMHNHLHLVLHVNVKQAKTWSDWEVASRRHKLFKGTILTQRFARQESLQSFGLETVESSISIYRERLADISWFMLSLNEFIARKANAEDNCTGRFWEGRFKSQALRDEAALLACMSCVNLNPVRAKIATTPEQSDFTSIQLRVRPALKGEQPKVLAKFIGNEHESKIKGLPFSLADYLTLVDATGRVIRDDKRGAIEAQTKHILLQLNISEDNWLKIATEFERVFSGAVEAPDKLSEYYGNIGLSRRHGISSSVKWLNTG